MKELEEEWGKLDPSPPKPTRLTRTQQEKQAQAPQVDEAVGGCDGGIAEEGRQEFVYRMKVNRRHYSLH